MKGRRVWYRWIINGHWTDGPKKVYRKGILHDWVPLSDANGASLLFGLVEDAATGQFDAVFVSDIYTKNPEARNDEIVFSS